MVEMKPYVPPTNGPTANVRFINDTGKNVSLMTYDDAKDCRGRKVVSYNAADKSILMPAYQRQLDFVVPANKELALSIGVAVSTTKTIQVQIEGGYYETVSCSMIISFPVDTNAQYEVSINLNEEEAICRTAVGEISSGKSVPVKTRWRERGGVPLTDAGSFCKEMTY